MPSGEKKMICYKMGGGVQTGNHVYSKYIVFAKNRLVLYIIPVKIQHSLQVNSSLAQSMSSRINWEYDSKNNIVSKYLDIGIEA